MKKYSSIIAAFGRLIPTLAILISIVLAILTKNYWLLLYIAVPSLITMVFCLSYARLLDTVDVINERLQHIEEKTK